MYIYRDSASIRNAQTSPFGTEFVRLINLRVKEWSEYEEFELSELVNIFVVESVDSMSTDNAVLGLALLDRTAM